MMFQVHWNYAKTVLNTLNINNSLGAKGYHLRHCLEYGYMNLWRIPIGYASEQPIEALNKTYGDIF